METRIYIVICGLVSTVAGYPSGAPDVACADMIPQHPASTASGTPPFAIQLSSNKYRAGAAVAGELSPLYPFFGHNNIVYHVPLYISLTRKHVRVIYIYTLLKLTFIL